MSYLHKALLQFLRQAQAAPVIIALVFASIVSAQPTLPNAAAAPQPEQQFVDVNGKPLAGAFLCTYAAGTSTPQATYTDSTAGTPNTNPVVLDSSGRASIWVGALLYKFVMQQGGNGACPGTGTTLWTQDFVGDLTLFFTNYVKTAGSCTIITYTPTITGGVTRTCSARLNDYYSLTDLGATCNGSTADDAAFTAAAALTNVTISLPAGRTCVLNGSSVAIPASVSLIVPQGSLISVSNTRTLTINSPFTAGSWQTFTGAGTVLLDGPNDRINVAWYGAVGDNSTDNTAAIAKAMNFASNTTQGLTKKVFFPSGVFLTDPITPMYVGMIIEGAGPFSSIVKSRVNTNGVFALTSTPTAHANQIRDLGIDGNGGAANVGISILNGGMGTFNVKISNVIINNIGGQCILANQDGTNNINIDQVECYSSGNNGIELRSGPANVVQNSYVHTVGSGFAAYRIYGTALLMNDNGIDGTIHSSTWAQIGNNSPLEYGFVTFVNDNIEDFGTNGIDVIQGFFRLINTQIIGNQAGTTVNAIRYETNFGNGVSGNGRAERHLADR